MKQPIAIDLKLLEFIRMHWEDKQINRAYTHMMELLETYHAIPIDDQAGKSDWIDGFDKIIQETNDVNINKAFRDSFTKQNPDLTFVKIKEHISNNLFEKLAEKTPDKIGVKSTSGFDSKIRYYSLSEFKSDNYDSNCRLFRFNKIIRFQPGTLFSPSVILSPFLRDAKRIEYFDRYLFKKEEYTDDVEFLFTNLDCVQKPSCITVFTDVDDLISKRHRENIEKKLLSKYGARVFKGMRGYQFKRSNHDRFIILDTDRMSIFFSTSFNNLKNEGNGQFKNRAAFRINFCKGRDYYE